MIKTVKLEDKYVEELIEVVLQSNKEDNTAYNQFMIDVPLELKKESMRKNLKNKKIQQTSIVALKDDKEIVGFFGGIDIQIVAGFKDQEVSHEKIKQWNHMFWLMYKPIIEKNLPYGTFMTGFLFCVKSGYKGLKIGQNFISNIYESGYKYLAGQFFNFKSAQLILKSGGKLYNELDLREIEVDGKFPFKEITVPVFGTKIYIIVSGVDDENFGMKSYQFPKL